MTTFYVRPSADGDGSSWDRARGFDSGLLEGAGPGDEVLLAAFDGPFRLDDDEGPQLTLRSGGAPDEPVTVRGAARDGAPARALVRGRRARPWTPGEASGGKEVVKLMPGADHLRFRDLDFADCGNGCFRFAGDVTDVVLEDMDVTNVRRFIENDDDSTEDGADVTDLVVRDVTVRGYSKGFARLQHHSQRILFEDCYGDSQRQWGDPFCIGVQLEGEVQKVDFLRCSMLNSDDRQDDEDTYWNGDGFSAEGNTNDVNFTDCFAAGHTDAGWDVKSRRATYTRCTAWDNKRNFRVWGSDQTFTDCSSISPNRRGGTGGTAHFWVGSDADRVRAVRPRLVGSGAISVNESSSLTLRDPVFQTRRDDDIKRYVDASSELAISGSSRILPEGRGNL